MNKQLKDLLILTIHNSPLTLSKSILQTCYLGAFEALKSANILKETEPDYLVECKTCGKVHKANKYKDGFILVCDSDPSAGFTKVEKEELVKYKFHWILLNTWLATQIGLSDDQKEIDGNSLWYLGFKNTAGKKHIFYLVQTDQLNRVIDTLQGIKNENPVILWVGDKPHDSIIPGNIISLVDLIDCVDDHLVFNHAALDTHFPAKITTREGDIVLDNNIVASKSAGAHQLKLGKRLDNSFEQVVRITPMEYNILFHLYTIRKYQVNFKTSKEMAIAGLSKTSRKVTSSIKELNDLTYKYHQKSLIVTLAGYKYALNPDLDCFK